MFLRSVLRRWRGGSVDTTTGGREGADACGAPPSLLTELAIDAEDFADLARVLHRDLPTVVRAIVTAQPSTVTALVAALETDAVTEPRVSTTPAAASPIAPSGGRGEAVGWGRWTRAHGGVRVHRETAATRSPPAMVAS